MAKLGDLIVNIGANTKQLDKNLGKVRREMKRFGSNFKALGRDLSRSVTLPLVAIGTAAIKSASDLETLETSFISLTGGAEQASDMMKQLNEFTAKTPFQIDAVANSARQLIASGTGIGEVNDKLQFLGDIAATSGSSINEIAAIFAKVNAKGKVELESLNQLAERGIPIFKALSDATGLPAEKLGAGRVSVEQFNAVLKSFAEEGGFAEGAMERLSETAAGKFSTAIDNLKIAGAQLVESLMPALKASIDRVTELAQKFTRLDTNTKKTTLQIAAAVAAIGPMLVVLPQVAAGVKLVIAAFTTSNPLLLAATVTLGALYVAFGDTSRRATQAADSIKLVTTRLNELNQAELMKEAGVRGKLTEEKLLDNILFSQDFVDEAQQRIDDLMATAKRTESGAIISIAVKSELDELREFRDEHQRIVDANELLRESLGNTQKTFKSVGSLLKELTETTVKEFNDGVSEMALKLHELSGMGTNAFQTLSNGVQQFTLGSSSQLLQFLNDFENVANVVEEKTEQMNNSINSFERQFSQGFANAIVDGENFVDNMKNLAKQLLQTLLSEAIANAITNASSAKNPANQLSAGLSIPAFIAAAVGSVKKAFGGVPALAAGGLAFGETMSIVGDNRNAAIDPEVIAPLSKLKDYIGGGSTNVYGRISGDDILISNARASRDRNRFA
jgi:tape measure domain-containing protein